MLAFSSSSDNSAMKNVIIFQYDAVLSPYPLLNLHDYGKLLFMADLTSKMVIFHSQVSLTMETEFVLELPFESGAPLWCPRIAAYRKNVRQLCLGLFLCQVFHIQPLF